MTSSNGNIFRVTGPLCGKFTGPGELPTHWPVTRSFDVFFDLRLNKWLSQQPWGWWFETLSCPLWCHGNAHRQQCYRDTFQISERLQTLTTDHLRYCARSCDKTYFCAIETGPHELLHYNDQHRCYHAWRKGMWYITSAFTQWSTFLRQGRPCFKYITKKDSLGKYLLCENAKVWQFLLGYPSFHIHEALNSTQIAKFMGPTWGPPGSCRPQMGPMMAPWTLLSRHRAFLRRGNEPPPCHNRNGYWHWLCLNNHNRYLHSHSNHQRRHRPSHWYQHRRRPSYRHRHHLSYHHRHHHGHQSLV